ncbi:MAG: aldose 1-epimerase family protein [Chordicoccus sp.]
MKTVLKNESLVFTVDTHGAEMQSLIKDGTEYLWSGDPKFWGRHAPVLFPIVGALQGGQYTFGGKTCHMGQHGFARDMEFELIGQTDTSLTYRLTENGKTLGMYPFRFVLEVGYELKENEVTVSWKVENPAETDLYFSIGGHPAFMCPPGGGEAFRGCGILLKKNGRRLDEIHTSPIDVEAGGLIIEDAPKRYALNNGVLTPSDELFADDALVLEDSQADEISLTGPDEKPYLTVTGDTPLVGIWSPAGKSAPFVCIEPWYGRADGVGFHGTLEEKKYERKLAPGGTFRGGYTIRL